MERRRNEEVAFPPLFFEKQRGLGVPSTSWEALFLSLGEHKRLAFTSIGARTPRSIAMYGREAQQRFASASTRGSETGQQASLFVSRFAVIAAEQKKQ